MVLASCNRMYSITECKDVEQVIVTMCADRGAVSPDRMRALFFLLLNVDMCLKEYICSPGNFDLYLTAFSFHDRGKREDRAALQRRHLFATVGVEPMQEGKARCFMTSLRRVVNDWLADEALSCADLIQVVKEEYLVS